MGLLSEGTPLDWPEVKKVADYVREHGIVQLINTFERLQTRTNDVLKWGDEVEYMVVRFDEEHKQAKLVLRGKEFLQKLKETAKHWPETDAGTVAWLPEFGRYMIESTPGGPYQGHLQAFLKVEKNMALRRAQAKAALPSDVHLLSLTVFPRLGCPGFTDPEVQPAPGGSVSKSLFFPDDAINEHPRFAALATNIRKRRGRKVAMNVPIFRDERTPDPFVEDFGPRVDGDPEGGQAALPNHIYMDAMGFGMGNSCLQVTFQATSISEATNLYDQLAPVCPIVLALSAASPIFRGYLADVDCRWDVISGSVDCRTPQELGQAPLTTDRMRISKSRYASISSYLSQSELNLPEYEDIPLEIDENVYKTLRDANFSEQLARHFAHLFIRDPLVVYSELLEQDDTKSTDHFENLQSTNWQTMRFKPPPVDSDIGWRVEFRPCEAQITDFENAAFTVFIVLLTRTILSFGLNLYMPLSKVDENMATAQKRDAVRKDKFWFPQCVQGDPREPLLGDDTDDDEDDDGDDGDGVDTGGSQRSSGSSSSSRARGRGTKVATASPNRDTPARGGDGDGNGDGGASGRQRQASEENEDGFEQSDVCVQEEETPADVPYTGAPDPTSTPPQHAPPGPTTIHYLSINEIINGSQDGLMPGLLPLIRKYIKSMSVDIDTSCQLNRYLDFIAARARGDVLTTAQWMRTFVHGHPKYERDSVVSDEVAYDLLKRILEITEGASEPTLLGKCCSSSASS